LRPPAHGPHSALAPEFPVYHTPEKKSSKKIGKVAQTFFLKFVHFFLDSGCGLRYNKYIRNEREVNKMNNINNLPEYAYEYPFIVVSICDDELWFYGAYDDYARAVKASNEIDGAIIRNI
jgi:hypothetical protein